MGEKAEKTEELEQNLPTEGEAEALAGALEGEAQGEEEGFEVTIDDPDSLPKSDTVPLGTFINTKRKWKDKAHDAEKSVEALRAENELLRMQLEQPKPSKAPEMPTLESAGFDDEEYRRQLLEYAKTVSVEDARQAVREELEKANQTQSLSQQDAEADRALDRHYAEANKLKVTDFDEAENKVIEQFGRKAAQQLIASSDRSHLLVYWLGKNPEKAAYYANLVKTQPLKGAMALGELEAKLQAKPKSKPTTVPDEPLEGGSTPANKDAMQRQLDKIRTEGKDGWFRASLAIQKKAQEAGFTLE
jgi:hypothetical protein